MARSGVKFSVGGKLTDVGKAVKNLTRRMTTYARKSGATVNTKDIRKQVRDMVNQGRSEQAITKTLNSIRDERIGEVFVNRGTGEFISNVTNLPLSPVDILKGYIDIDSDLEGRMDNSLIKAWFADLERDYGATGDLDTILQKNAQEIQDALETVIYGYLDKGLTQGLDTSLIRLYELSGVDMTWDRRQAIYENVERFQWYSAYGYRPYDEDDFE